MNTRPFLGPPPHFTRPPLTSSFSQNSTRSFLALLLPLNLPPPRGPTGSVSLHYFWYAFHTPEIPYVKNITDIALTCRGGGTPDVRTTWDSISTRKKTTRGKRCKKKQCDAACSRARTTKISNYTTVEIVAHAWPRLYELLLTYSLKVGTLKRLLPGKC